MPVGTGRFLRLYEELDQPCPVAGVDASEEMLRLAKRKKSSAALVIGDATDLIYEDTSFDAVVCVRFLDLLPWMIAMEVLREIMRVARRTVILTVRLGPETVEKSNTSTFSDKAFRMRVRKAGWTVKMDHHEPFQQGWRVMMLERAS